MGAAADSVEELRAEFARVMEDARRADFRNFTTLEGEEKWLRIVARASLPVALRIATDAQNLLAMMTGSETEPEPLVDDAAFDLFGFDEVPTQVLGRRQPSVRPNVSGVQLRNRALEDTAFMVHSELRQRVERLRRLNDLSDPLSVIGECDGVLRRVRRGLGAVGVLMPGGPSEPGEHPPVDGMSELSEALMVRRAYARARHFFATRGAPTAATLHESLRRTAGRLENLCTGEVASVMRVRDRLQIAHIRGRVHEWLENGATDVVAGMRLWQDCAGFFQMIHQINRRQELMEHDASVVADALARLESLRDATARLGVVMESRLARLEGLDEELDALLEDLHHGVSPALQAALQRVGMRFGITPTQAGSREGVA